MQQESHWELEEVLCRLFFVIVTAAPVSEATALKETLPEYVFAVSAVIDPPTDLESLY